MNIIKSILIVGGGTAGLISALILKKHLDISVDVVYSKNIGIIGVGEGSTEHFKEFMDFVGINQYDLIKECDATYKSGIMFKDWGAKDYFHSVIGNFNIKAAQYSYVYAKQISERSNYLTFDYLWKNKIETWYLNKEDEFFCNQYHFNTHKLNEYLIKLAIKNDIKIYEDDIEKINLNNQGEIDNLQGQHSKYDYDFYIDATGFKRLLLKELGYEWNSFNKFLKMNSAIVFQTEDEDNYNLWTLAKAMSAGWLFRIPVWGRYGNGYIFNKDYIDETDAVVEIENYLGKKIEIGKRFSFDPGCVKNAWIKNCCAIGLASNFVEPLEASSIGTSIQQSFLLMHLLQNYTESSIKKYNKSFSDIMENIRDFVILHYITDKRSSDFWIDIAKLELPSSLSDKLIRWRANLPINEDFNEMSDYILFRADNFTLVMDGLDLFDRQSIYQEYQSKNQSLKNRAEEQIYRLKNIDNNSKFINHKDYIRIIRDFL